MAVQGSIEFEKYLVQLGDGESPETFSRPCGLKARTFGLENTPSENQLLDCSDESMPMAVVTATEIVAAAKVYAPKGSGEGAEAIGWREGEHDLQRVIFAADDDTFYMRFQEFGAEDVPAHPFFFPAYRLNRKRGARRIKAAVNKALRKDAGV